MSSEADGIYSAFLKMWRSHAETRHELRVIRPLKTRRDGVLAIRIACLDRHTMVTLSAKQLGPSSAEPFAQSEADANP
jgi:hypothetical protein